MRLPRDVDDLARKGQRLHDVRVFLNGELMTRVVEADDSEGWLTRMSRDAHGQLVLERLEGSIQIR